MVILAAAWVTRLIYALKWISSSPVADWRSRRAMAMPSSDFIPRLPLIAVSPAWQVLSASLSAAEAVVMVFSSALSIVISLEDARRSRHGELGLG